MVAVELVQRHREVRVEAQQDHKHRSYEIIDGGLTHRRKNRAGQDADDRRERSADVRAEHDGARVLWRKLCRHSVSRVLEDAAGHVENDDRHHRHPEERAGPFTRVDHRQYDGDEKDDDFDD